MNIASISISGEITLNLHSLNNEGGEGNQIITRQLSIIDKNGEELPLGEVGEIAVSGPNTMLGYWNNAKQTATTLINGWVMTGDAGYMDEDGFIFLVDRLKDMIVTGGENVFSAEVENALSHHTAIQESVVLGILLFIDISILENSYTFGLCSKVKSLKANVLL